MTNPESVDQMGALAQHVRLQIMQLLASSAFGEMAAGDIAVEIGVKQNVSSTHLNILARTGLVKARRDGRRTLYSVDNAVLETLLSRLRDTLLPPA